MQRRRSINEALSGGCKTLPYVLVVVVLLTGCVSLTPYDQIVAELPPENLLEIDDRRIYVEDSGRGEAVMLVHGFGSSSYAWREVIADLETSYRVISIDLAGFGFTERPAEKAAYTRFAQGELMIDVADALGIERFHLVGHSYGGAVGAALAVRRPERIATLTLLNAAGPIYPQLRRTKLASFRPLTFAFVRTKSLRKSNIERALKRSFADDELATEALVAEYQRRLAIEGAPRAFWGLTVPMVDPQDVVELSELTVPTLALWGADDVLIPVELAREKASKIAEHRFALIEGAGHSPLEERPHEVAEALRRFFVEGLAAFGESASPPPTDRAITTASQSPVI